MLDWVKLAETPLVVSGKETDHSVVTVIARFVEYAGGREVQ